MNYKDKRWLRKREYILRQAEYKCEECARYLPLHLVPEAKHVHHIIPAKMNPRLFLNSRNLIALCSSCHNKMHDRSHDVLSEKGKLLARRIFREENF